MSTAHPMRDVLLRYVRSSRRRGPSRKGSRDLPCTRSDPRPRPGCSPFRGPQVRSTKPWNRTTCRSAGSGNRRQERRSWPRHARTYRQLQYRVNGRQAEGREQRLSLGQRAGSPSEPVPSVRLGSGLIDGFRDGDLPSKLLVWSGDPRPSAMSCGASFCAFSATLWGVLCCLPRRLRRG